MKLADVITSEYREQLLHLSRANAWSGGGAKFAQEIYELAQACHAKTVLDYGCGPGTLKLALAELAPELEVREYDPGVDGMEVLPGPADLVVCIDVLEHIEPQKLHSVLFHIFCLMQNVAFLTIATRPAEKRLPDGRNAHLIIDNASWWIGELKKQAWRVKRIKADGDAGELKVWLLR